MLDKLSSINNKLQAIIHATFWGRLRELLKWYNIFFWSLSALVISTMLLLCLYSPFWNVHIIHLAKGNLWFLNSTITEERCASWLSCHPIKWIAFLFPWAKTWWSTVEMMMQAKLQEDKNWVGVTLMYSYTCGRGWQCSFLLFFPPEVWGFTRISHFKV